MEAVYQSLLLDKDIRKALYDVMLQSNEADGYLIALATGAIENEDKYEEMFQANMRSDWEFERLSLLEQAILLISAQDILENGTPKAVAINEAVTLAKEYCDESAPKLINGLLDHLQ